MWRVKGTLILVFAQFLTCGCNSLALPITEQNEPPPQYNQAASEPDIFQPAKDCGGNFSPEQRMYLELVHKMVEQKRYYGALANLDQLEKNATPSPQTIYLRAEALRGSGQLDAAEKQYRLLLNGCMVGYGLHGLGLVASETRQWAKAQDFLERACRERPVDADTHNDLGMVLLLRGDLQGARQEFMTSIELDHDKRLPVENLIVLMLIEKQDTLAQQFATERGLSTQDMERLAQRAQQLNKP